MHIKELLSIPAAVLLIVSAATTQGVAQGTLSAGSVNGRAGQTTAVPITLNAGSAQIVNFSATFSVMEQGGAPAITDKLTYQAPTPPGAPQLTDDTVTGSFAIGYVNDISPALTGTLVIATLQVPIPAAAMGSYQVQVRNVSALDPNGNDVSITGQNGTITLPVAGNTLSAGDVNGQAGQTASVPITMKVGSAHVVNFSATFSVVAQGGAPAITDKLTYQAATPPGPPQLTDDTVTGSFAIGYVNDISPSLTGTLVIGTLEVPIPAGATGSYQVQAHNVSALDPNGNDVSITGQSGTITVGAVLSAGTINGQAGQMAAVPITLKAGTAQVSNFSATFTVVAQCGAPAIAAKLTYQAATPPGPPQLTDDTVTGSFAIGYVNDISPPLTGTLVIGTLMVPIPAGASGSY